MKTAEEITAQIEEIEKSIRYAEKQKAETLDADYWNNTILALGLRKVALKWVLGID
jgi:hypothetical protein